MSLSPYFMIYFEAFSTSPFLRHTREDFLKRSYAGHDRDVFVLESTFQQIEGAALFRFPNTSRPVQIDLKSFRFVGQCALGRVRRT